MIPGWDQDPYIDLFLPPHTGVGAFEIWARNKEEFIPSVVSVTIKAYLLNEVPKGSFQLEFSNIDPQNPSVIGVTQSIIIGCSAAVMLTAIHDIHLVGMKSFMSIYIYVYIFFFTFF